MARGQTKYSNLETATESGVIQHNIELATSLLFSKGNVLKIQGQDYSIYSSSLKTWKKTSSSPSYQAKVTLFLVKGTKVSFRKRQDLSCSDKRRKLRESLKKVLNIDIGEPKGKQFVPKRLIPPQTRTQSRPLSRFPYMYPGYGRPYPIPTGQSRGYPTGAPYPYPYQYPYGQPMAYRQNAGKRRTRVVKRKNRNRRTRKLKQKALKLI
jgi:hypothetical protein